jgi:hypothetical protein
MRRFFFISIHVLAANGIKAGIAIFQDHHITEKAASNEAAF